MTVAQRCELQHQILDILRASGRELAVSDIETRLRGEWAFNTFDVRDAVRRLIDQEQAEWTPRLYIKPVSP